MVVRSSTRDHTRKSRARAIVNPLTLNQAKPLNVPGKKRMSGIELFVLKYETSISCKDVITYIIINSLINVRFYMNAD